MSAGTGPPYTMTRTAQQIARDLLNVFSNLTAKGWAFGDLKSQVLAELSVKMSSRGNGLQLHGRSGKPSYG